MENNIDSGKTFQQSVLSLENRQKLSLSGVEKVYELNETKLQLKVAGSNLVVNGQNLNVTRLDVESGVLEVAGRVDEIKFATAENKNIFKRIFK